MLIRTFDKNDPQLREHLLGTFSETSRAIATKTLNLGMPTEQVTFQIVDKADIKHPPWSQLVARTLRLENLALVWGPSITVLLWAKLLSHSIQMNIWLVATLSVSLLLLFALTLNDYMDHLKGRDRTDMLGGSRVIQQGWITAWQMRNIALTLFVLGCLSGLYLLVQLDLSVWIFAVLGLVGLFLSQRLPQMIGFLFLGPVLVVGLAWASVGRFDWSLLAWGLAYGAMVGIGFFVKSLRNILVDGVRSTKSLALHLGFDRAKSYLLLVYYFVLLMLIAGMLANQMLLWGALLGIAYWVLVKTIWMGPLTQAPSCLSSAVIQARHDWILHYFRFALCMNIGLGVHLLLRFFWPLY